MFPGASLSQDRDCYTLSRGTVYLGVIIILIIEKVEFFTPVQPFKATPSGARQEVLKVAKVE